jgi:hypothetical protein
MATHRAQLHHRQRNGNAELPRRTLAAGELGVGRRLLRWPRDEYRVA